MYFILGYFQQNIDGNILWKLKKPSILSPFCPFKANKDFSGKSLDLYCCAEFQKKNYNKQIPRKVGYRRTDVQTIVSSPHFYRVSS